MMSFHHHVDLLLRWDRGLMLRQVVQEIVRPGMRVLDAGTGSGIVALWAAQAGAEVVGVDMADVSLAQALAEENDLSEQVSFIREDLGAATVETLGGRFDALTAMVYYNDPRRDEAQSRLVLDLRERLLAPGAPIIPGQVVYSATLCEWADQDLSTKRQALRSRQSELEGRYGLRFGPLVDQALLQPHPLWFPVRRDDGTVERAGSRFLSPVVQATVVDYESGHLEYPSTLAIPVTASGMATCILWNQELKHGDTIVFRNESVGWLQHAARVSEGDEIAVRLDETWRSTNVLSIDAR